MNKEEYRIMYELEDTHWRCVGMRKIYFSLLNKFYKDHSGLKILDAGCGTGIMLEEFKKYGSPVGVDISEEALYFCHLRRIKRVVCASVEVSPFMDKSFDLITALEVIYHLRVRDDIKALEEFYRILKEGSRIILCVPAFNFLRSQHDEVVHTRCRYTKSEIKRKIERVGFKIEKITYINTILFPLICLLRFVKRLNKIKDKSQSDLRPTPKPINKMLILVLAIEEKLLKIMNFPFGVSILCIAHK